MSNPIYVCVCNMVYNLMFVFVTSCLFRATWCPIRELRASTCCPVREFCTSTWCPIRELCASTRCPIRIMCFNTVSNPILLVCFNMVSNPRMVCFSMVSNPSIFLVTWCPIRELIVFVTWHPNRESRSGGDLCDPVRETKQKGHPEDDAR